MQTTRNKKQSHLYYVRHKVQIRTAQWRYRLRKLYGMTVEGFLELLTAQDNKCAICKTTDPQTKNGGTFVIDHSHTTGKVRGLLCSPCNRALGLLKDNAGILEKAAEYVRTK